MKLKRRLIQLSAKVCKTEAAMANRHFVADFIETYKNAPCLWNKSDPRYHITSYREAAYNLLLKKFQEYDGKATKTMVKAKINSLRSTYNKELRKLKASQKSASRTGNVYKGTLWYFDLISFISDQHPTVGNVNTMDDEYNDLEEDDLQCISDKDDDDDIFSIKDESSNSSLTLRKKRSVGRIVENEDPLSKKVIHLVADRLEETDIVPAGKHENFVKHVCEELNNLKPEMVPYVKRVINLAIFEGHMKTLNETSSILTQNVPRQPHRHFQNGPVSSTRQPSQPRLQQVQNQYRKNVSPQRVQRKHPSLEEFFGSI